MLRLILVIFAIFALVPGQAICRNADPAENVNSRYTVESVEVLGFAKAKLSRGLRDRLDKMVGTKFDTMALTGVVWKIREEVRAKHINVRVAKGTKPEHLAVRLEVEGQRDKNFDITSPKFGYHSRQGFSGSMEGILNANRNVRLAVGFSNDGDLLLERYQGFHARAEVRIPKSPVTLAFRYASLGQTWIPAVTETGSLYGTREVFEPVATINLARGLQWSSGVSIQRLDKAAVPHLQGGVLPNMAAPHMYVASNAVVNTLRYRRQFEGTGDHRQELEAGYDLRAATRTLSSDYSYQRHTLSGAYTFVNGHHQVRVAALAGTLDGTAPLFDRFVLGNAQTLRGYNKFDIAPNGARRIAHGSVDYQYRLLQAFYDTGAIAVVGSNAGMSEVRHSVGVGLRKDILQLAVAFPLRGVRMDPIFLVGVNF